jgi:diguanylate cyclase (GGDEF)-like protein
VTPAIGVHLPISVVIWLLIGEVLADRSARSRRQTDRLAAQVIHDGLTGLMNRMGLLAELQRALSDVGETDGASFLFLLDIDGFKSVNDTFGHPGGDELLIAFAQHIRDTIRTIDVAARRGGDEFAVLIKGSNVAIATSLGVRPTGGCHQYRRRHRADRAARQVVLEQACRQGAEWQPLDVGRQLTISVNVSPHQLIDGHLYQSVKSALAVSGGRSTSTPLPRGSRLPRSSKRFAAWDVRLPKGTTTAPPRLPEALVGFLERTRLCLSLTETVL